MTNHLHSFKAIVALLTPIRAYDHRHWHPWPWLCAILAGLEAAMVDGTCSARDCKREGMPCFFPDHTDPHPPDDFLCWEHIERSGFCRGCGRFWGGVESFEVSRSKLCDDCQHEADMDFERDFDGEWNEDPYYEEAYL